MSASPTSTASSDGHAEPHCHRDHRTARLAHPGKVISNPPPGRPNGARRSSHRSIIRTEQRITDLGGATSLARSQMASRTGAAPRRRSPTWLALIPLVGEWRRLTPVLRSDQTPLTPCGVLAAPSCASGAASRLNGRGPVWLGWLATTACCIIGWWSLYCGTGVGHPGTLEQDHA